MTYVSLQIQALGGSLAMIWITKVTTILISLNWLKTKTLQHHSSLAGRCVFAIFHYCFVNPWSVWSDVSVVVVQGSVAGFSVPSCSASLLEIPFNRCWRLIMYYTSDMQGIQSHSKCYSAHHESNSAIRYAYFLHNERFHFVSIGLVVLCKDPVFRNRVTYVLSVSQILF